MEVSSCDTECIIFYRHSHSGEIFLRVFVGKTNIRKANSVHTSKPHLAISFVGNKADRLISICLTSGFFNVDTKLRGKDRGEDSITP